MGCTESRELQTEDDALPLGPDGQPIAAAQLPESEADQAALFEQLREELGGPAGPFPASWRKWKPEHYAAAAVAGYSRRAITQLKLARARQGGQAFAERNIRRIGAVGSTVGSALGTAAGAALGTAPSAGWEELVQTGAGWSFSTALTSLAVVLDQPCSQPGGVLAGAVALNLMAPLASTGVYLKIKGVERCRWRTKHQRTERRYEIVRYQCGTLPDGTQVGAPVYDWVKHTVTYYLDHEAVNVLVKFQVPLRSGGTIPAGQHLLPFRISLSPALPPSCKLSRSSLVKEQEFTAEVCYAIKAVCGIEGTLSPNLRHDQELVLASPNGSTADMLMDAARDGAISALMTMEGGSWLAGQPVRFRVEAHNPPSKPISCIKAKVMRELALVGDGTAKEGGNLFNLREEVCSKSYAGFDKGQGGGSRELELVLPARLESGSTNGAHVQCRYFLHVKCTTGLFGTALRMRLPLSVCGKPQQRLFGPEQLPADWAPRQIAEPVFAGL